MAVVTPSLNPATSQQLLAGDESISAATVLLSQPDIDAPLDCDRPDMTSVETRKTLKFTKMCKPLGARSWVVHWERETLAG
eukprot:Skav232509  [mRNA]  locus=scaffold1096:289049:289291:+ [translate_table: standard]